MRWLCFVFSSLAAILAAYDAIGKDNVLTWQQGEERQSIVLDKADPELQEALDEAMQQRLREDAEERDQRKARAQAEEEEQRRKIIEAYDRQLQRRLHQAQLRELENKNVEKERQREEETRCLLTTPWCYPPCYSYPPGHPHYRYNPFVHGRVRYPGPGCLAPPSTPSLEINVRLP